jgi:hypothetical protein
VDILKGVGGIIQEKWIGMLILLFFIFFLFFVVDPICDKYDDYVRKRNGQNQIISPFEGLSKNQDGNNPNNATNNPSPRGGFIGWFWRRKIITYNADIIERS